MSWFKVDDNFHSHPKVKSIPRRERAAALGLWVQAGSWSAQQLTDGFVPDYMIEEFGVTGKLAQLLGDATLWTRSAENNGWVFKDWASHQPSRAEVEEKRSAGAARIRAYRERQKAAGNAGVTRYEGVSNANPGNANPDPTRPDPTRTAVPTELLEEHSPPVSAKRARPKSNRTRIPEGFALTPDMADWARSQCPNITDAQIDLFTRKFIGHWTDATRNALKSNWLQAWRNWIEEDFGNFVQHSHSNGYAAPIPKPNAATVRNADSEARVRRLWAEEHPANNNPTQLALGKLQ